MGADRSRTMVAAASQHAGATGARFVVADAGALPFGDAAFDRATGVTVLCVVAEPGRVVRELARVVRGGGRLVLGELGRWSSWALARRLRGWVRGGLWRRARWFTAAGVRRLLAAAGLVPVAVRGAVFYPPSAAAARRFPSGLEGALRGTTAGAAFIAIAAEKPPAGVP